MGSEETGVVAPQKAEVLHVPQRQSPDFPPAVFALVVAVCALLVAVGGTGYALAAIPKHSVGAAELKKNAVRSKAVKDHSLKTKDFRAGQLPSK